MTSDRMVSIVAPTFNRLSRLTTCIGKVRANVSIPFELVVVDGGSTNGTREYLAHQLDLHVILERRREGRRYSIYNIRGYPYANFGLLRRSLLERIGFADERFYFFGFDPDLSLKVQLEAGLKVVGCRDALIHHEEYHDDRKMADVSIGEDDNEKLFAKWNLPEKNSYADPAPTYQQLVRERLLI